MGRKMRIDLFPQNINKTKDIDIRDEIYKLFHIEKKSHNIIYRRFDKTRKSEFYIPSTGEAVNGPKFEYTDEVWKTRREDNPADHTSSIPGDFHVNYSRFYFEYSTHPRIDDEIFEIGLDNVGEVIVPYIYLNRWIVNQVIPWREKNNGRIEYYEVFVKKENIKW